MRCHLGEDPGRGDWFVFINRRRTQLKILTYEAGGYCLWSKRLEQGQFALLFTCSSVELVKRKLDSTNYIVAGLNPALKY